MSLLKPEHLCWKLRFPIPVFFLGGSNSKATLLMAECGFSHDLMGNQKACIAMIESGLSAIGWKQTP